MMRQADDQDRQRVLLLEETIARVEATFAALPPRCHSHLGNALLNLALGRLVEQHGQGVTAQLLERVQHSLALDACPPYAGSAIDPFRLDS